MRFSRAKAAWIAAALATTATLLGLELVARVVEQRRQPPRVRRYVAADPTLRELKTFGDLDTTSQRGLYKGILYETNHLRLRSPERPLAKPEGVVRVALLGDSFVMGAGVLIEDAYANLLESALPSMRPGRYEVINTGMSGLDAEHAVARYGELGIAYDPDLAIYGFTINDIEGSYYEKSVAAVRDPYGVEQSPLALWRLAGPGWIAVREAFWPPVGSYVNEIRHNYFHNDAAWRDFASALDRLGEIDEKRSMCTVVFLHTYLVTLNSLHPFKMVYAKVADAARQRGFFAIESLGVHLGRDEKSLWVNPFDSHPNEEGHRLLAEALTDGLRALPEKCWESKNRR